MKMNKYIELKAAIDAVVETYYDTPDINLNESRLEAALMSVPAADVLPVVHGRWIDNELDGYKWAFICSKCGYVDGYPFNSRHNYCPNCGTKMDGGDSNAPD